MNKEKKNILQIDPEQLGISPEVFKGLQQYADRISKAYYPTIQQYQPVLNTTVIKQLNELTSAPQVMSNLQNQMKRLIETASFTQEIKAYRKMLKPINELAQVNSQVLELMETYNQFSQAIAQHKKLGETITNELTIMNASWISQISLHVPPDYLRLTEMGADRGKQKTTAISLQETENNFNGKMESLLSDIDSDLPSLRQGAWEAYNSDTEDRWRQASSSARELVRQTIDKLSQNGETRKEKVKDILSDSGLESDTIADLIDDCAEITDGLYCAQSKITHTNFRHDDFTRFILVVSEELAYLLANNEKNG